MLISEIIVDDLCWYLDFHDYRSRRPEVDAISAAATASLWPCIRIYIYIYIYILHCYASHYSTYCSGERSIYFYQMETSTIWYCFYAGICQVVCMFVYLIQLPSGIHQLTLSVNCTCAPVDCIVHFVWYSLCNALKVCNARSFGMIKAVREQKLLMIWWKCSSCWTQIPMVANIIPIIDIRWFRKQSCDWEYAAAVD